MKVWGWQCGSDVDRGIVSCSGYVSFGLEELGKFGVLIDKLLVLGDLTERLGVTVYYYGGSREFYCDVVVERCYFVYDLDRCIVGKGCREWSVSWDYEGRMTLRVDHVGNVGFVRVGKDIGLTVVINVKDNYAFEGVLGIASDVADAIASLIEFDVGRAAIKRLFATVEEMTRVIDADCVYRVVKKVIALADLFP